MNFDDLKTREKIFLYAGDLQQWNFTTVRNRFAITEKKWVGLTLPKYGDNGAGTRDENHILFDIMNKMPLDDDTVDIYQSEDVHEHLEYEELIEQINDIYRVLKPEGLFRLSVPDYNCDILYNRTRKDDNGNLIFDSGGGGYYDADEKKVKGNGHVWFPNYEKVKRLLENTEFKNINFLNYWTDREDFVIKEINYKNGYIHRTPDNDGRVKDPRRPMSIVVDCYK
jgi:SAM-dependent methyltransferase